MLDGKSIISTTREVTRGAPVMVMIYRPEHQWQSSRAGSAGAYTGWMFLHDPGAAEEADLCFFDSINPIDTFVEEVLSGGRPGIYYREDPLSAFEGPEPWD